MGTERAHLRPWLCPHVRSPTLFLLRTQLLGVRLEAPATGYRALDTRSAFRGSTREDKAGLGHLVPGTEARLGGRPLPESRFVSLGLILCGEGTWCQGPQFRCSRIFQN